MSDRVEVLKTYKLYIGGKFDRTESGRYFKILDKSDKVIANLCQASRKDFRNAVSAARKAQDAWNGRSAYNKGQILYRIAENLEGRKAEFVEVFKKENGSTAGAAMKMVEKAIDTFIYFAGWADKYQAIYSSVNPVASSHFNFSILEPTGVVSGIMDQKSSFDQLVSFISSSIVGGNTTIVLVTDKISLSAMTLAEVIHHSDVPPGVINILTGYPNELLVHMVGHMDVNSFLYWGDQLDWIKKIDELSETNLKRTAIWSVDKKDVNSPYSIYEFQEVKTTWHPIEQIGGATSAY